MLAKGGLWRPNTAVLTSKTHNISGRTDCDAAMIGLSRAWQSSVATRIADIISGMTMTSAGSSLSYVFPHWEDSR